MRMNLYEVEIEREDRRVRGYIVSPSEPRAVRLVAEHNNELGEEHTSFTLQRIDEDLPDDRREGLDDMLESAPVGFASYCDPIGWIVHAAAVHKLRFFRIEDRQGNETFIIAPSADVAAAIYSTGTPLAEGQHRLFRIFDGLENLPEERRGNLDKLLEAGPVGIAEFDEEAGWLIW